MDNLISILNHNNLQVIKQYISVCKDTAIRFIEEKLEIKLDSELTDEVVEKLKQFEKDYGEHIIKSIRSCDSAFQNKLLDLTNARNSELEKIKSNAPLIIKITPSLLAVLTIVTAAVLDGYILVEGFSKGLEALNPVITLIAGHSSAKSAQVLGYYFGSSDNK